MAPNDSLRGVRGQGGPTGPVYPEGLSQTEMDRVRAGRYVPPDPNAPAQMQSAPTPTPSLPQLNPATVTGQAVSNTGGFTVPQAQFHGVEWKAPDLSRYDTQFQESLAASRENITNQFQRALEDINAQEGIANKVVETLPGRYDEIWGGAEQRTQQGNEAALTALGRSGLGGMLTQEELMAPQLAALQGGKAAYQASVPLTQLGTQELFTRQKGALAQARMGAEEPLNEAVRQWLGTRSGQDLQAGLAQNEFMQTEASRRGETDRFNIGNVTEESRFTRGLKSEEERFNAEQKAAAARFNAEQANRMKEITHQTNERIREETAKVALDPKATPNDELKARFGALLTTFGPRDPGAGRGAIIVAQKGDDWAAVQGDKDYQYWAKTLNDWNNKGTWKTNDDGTQKPDGNAQEFTDSVEDAARNLEAKGKFRSAAVLRHLYGGSPNEQAERIASLQEVALG